MSEKPLDQFTKKKFINLETYRKAGTPVRTPVWFAEENGILFVITGANSGKVKRIRRNPLIKLTPCNYRGDPQGEWVNAEVKILDHSEMKRVNQLLLKKYGLQKKIADLLSGPEKEGQAPLEIHLS
jgi:uncharacterized protein